MRVFADSGKRPIRRSGRDTMLADLDRLLISVFCAADDFLPEPAKNARRIVTDAEVVTLAVAQAIMGISSDARFIRTARKQLVHLFPVVPNRPGYLKRRRRLSDTIEWLMTVFASDSPGFYDDLGLVDSTPIECARSVETTRRSQLADAADYGYCASHSRYLLGLSPARPVRAGRHPPRAHADLAEDARTRRLPTPARPHQAIRPPVRGRRQRL